MHDVVIRCAICEAYRTPCPQHREFYEKQKQENEAEIRLLEDIVRREKGERAVDEAWEKFKP